MGYALLADLLTALHLAFVLWVVAGQILIVLGAILRWRWIRNPWFRLLHLASIVFVAAEALGGMVCPLTTWEAQLREAAGQAAAQGTFEGRLLRSVLFVEVASDRLTLYYVAFGLVVLAFFCLVPPRWRRGAAAPGRGDVRGGPPGRGGGSQRP